MTRQDLIEAELTRSAIGAFYTVYNALGFGFMERLYANALEHELRDRGHEVGREVAVDVWYDRGVLGRQRLDMVVDRKLVVEVKSTELLHPSARRQLLSYLRSTNLEIGLLLHFGPQPKFVRLVHTNDRKEGRPGHA